MSFLKQGVKLLMVFSCFVLSVMFSGEAKAIDIEEDITTDTVWAQNMSPYIIRNNIVVLEGVNLIISEGTEIKFASNTVERNSYSITIKGTLTAQGVAGNPILFTREGEDQYWGSIDFSEESLSWNNENLTGSVMEYCIIEYGGNATATFEKGMVRVFSTSPKLSNNLLRYSENTGIVAYSNILNITDNKIYDTRQAIRIVGADGGIVTNNYLVNNRQGIKIDTASGFVEINKNTIDNASNEIFGGCLGINLKVATNFDSYLWSQISGPPVELSDSSSIYPEFTTPETSKDEELLFQLIVTDSTGLQSSDIVSVNIAWENLSPVSNAGADIDVVENNIVLLNGSSSYDADDGIVSYFWEKTSGPDVIFKNQSSVNAKYCLFTAPEVDEYGDIIVFQLTVTDKAGLESKDTVIINIFDSQTENIPPVVSAGNEQIVPEESDVIITGTGSDTNGNIDSWRWKQTEGSTVDIINATNPVISFRTPEVDENGETLFFKVTVTDNNGSESSDTIAISVIDDDSATPNEPPIANAGADQTQNENEIVTLDGLNSTDADGLISKYEWIKLSGPSVTLIGTTSKVKKTFKINNITKDEVLVFNLIVTDDKGLKSEDTITININNLYDIPVANAKIDNEGDIFEGDIVFLNGRESVGNDGDIDSVLWEQTGGSSAIQLSDNTVSDPYFTAPDVLDEELYVFRLTIKDDNGDFGYDSVQIKIFPKDESPVVDAGSCQAVLAGSDVTLKGVATDPDGADDIISWLWEQTGGKTVTLYNATTAEPFFTAPQLYPDDTFEYNSLVFRLTVKDKTGLVSTDSVIVNIVADMTGNLPVADAGEPQNTTSGTKVILNGSGSFDPDDKSSLSVINNEFSGNHEENEGNLIAVDQKTESNCALSLTSNNFIGNGSSYFVYIYKNQATSEINNQIINMKKNWWGTEQDSSISGMIYDKIMDQTLAKVDYSEFQTDLIPEAGSSLSCPPMADAGEDREEEIETTVTLDGTSKFDPDNNLTYLWTQTEGLDVSLADADSSIATFTVPTPDRENNSEDAGTLRFKLIVTDSEQFVSTDDVVITINNSETDETDSNTRKSSGCFISTLSDD